MRTPSVHSHRSRASHSQAQNLGGAATPSVHTHVVVDAATPSVFIQGGAQRCCAAASLAEHLESFSARETLEEAPDPTQESNSLPAPLDPGAGRDSKERELRRFLRKLHEARGSCTRGQEVNSGFLRNIQQGANRWTVAHHVQAKQWQPAKFKFVTSTFK